MGVKLLGCKTGQSHPSGVKVKKAYSYTSTHPYVLMACTATTSPLPLPFIITIHNSPRPFTQINKKSHILCRHSTNVPSMQPAWSKSNFSHFKFTNKAPEINNQSHSLSDSLFLIYLTSDVQFLTVQHSANYFTWTQLVEKFSTCQDLALQSYTALRPVIMWTEVPWHHTNM